MRPLSAEAARISTSANNACKLGYRGEPLAHLLKAVLAQAAHPLAQGDVADLLGRAALECHAARVGGHPHHLVDAQTPTIAVAAAATTTDRLIRLQVDECFVAVLAQHFGGHDR